MVLHFYFNLAMTGAFVFGVWIRNGQSVFLSKGQVICISVDSISQIHIALVSTEHRGGGDERLCWMCDCTCLESDRSKSSGQLGHQLHRQTLAGQDATNGRPWIDMDLSVFQAETGIQLYRVVRGKDNFSLGSTLN